jgi:hypothetical protein
VTIRHVSSKDKGDADDCKRGLMGLFMNIIHTSGAVSTAGECVELDQLAPDVQFYNRSRL